MSGRSGRRVTGPGAAYRRCPVCYREVLTACQGEVMAVGKARLVRVDRDGNIHAACECGKTVVWEREVSRPA